MLWHAGFLVPKRHFCIHPNLQICSLSRHLTTRVSEKRFFLLVFFVFAPRQAPVFARWPAEIGWNFRQWRWASRCRSPSCTQDHWLDTQWSFSHPHTKCAPRGRWVRRLTERDQSEGGNWFSPGSHCDTLHPSSRGLDGIIKSLRGLVFGVVKYEKAFKRGPGTFIIT